MKKVKKYKISRRLRAPLFEKCQTQKFVLREQRRDVDRRGRRSPSDYGKQLMEKQKLRYLYGVSERVLKNYVNKAVAMQNVSTESMLTELLERRLDAVVYNLGLAPTRRMARQMVSHGHFTVNDRKVTVPSYRVRDTDSIGVREGSLRTKLFRSVFSDGNTVRPRADWVRWDSGVGRGMMTAKPVIKESIFSIPAILEYYSR